jgi:4-amino-4-deoxy-L-arabinose transferase-like glycosyltransferase
LSVNKILNIQTAGIIVLVAFLFAAAIAFRPVLPIDETRYMTVAWEFFLHHDYSLPTLNFEPYYHKPPLLFFLIDTTWDILGGVSRWAALIPLFISALAFVFMTRALARRLYPGREGAHERLLYIAVGSVPFLIYSTIIMFDIMLSVFVLGFFLMVLSDLEKPSLWKLLAAGIFLGLGGLTKGPVVLLYSLMPLALAAVYERRSKTAPRHAWPRVLIVPLVVGLGLVSIWLVDLVLEVGPDFINTLIFTQTLDRMNGKMESSHARPFYFYLPMLPVLFLPWALFPSFWRSARSVLADLWRTPVTSLPVLWFAGGFIVFSIISGKQPHYLVPLLPPALIFTALCLEKVSLRAVQVVALVMVLLVCAGQFVAQKAVFAKYDLEPLAKIVAAHPDKDWAFVRKYQGELGFLGRIEHHIDSLEFTEVDLWFRQHPDGYMIIRHHPDKELPKYHRIFSMPYRSRMLGVYTASPDVPALHENGESEKKE